MQEIRPELIDELLKGYQKPEEITGEGGLLKRLTKAILERALESEMTHELGYEKHSPAGRNRGNSRNGKSGKTLQTDYGELAITVPRDRRGEFEPQIVKKGQRRFTGFDDKILSITGIFFFTSYLFVSRGECLYNNIKICHPLRRGVRGKTDNQRLSIYTEILTEPTKITTKG